MKRVYTHNIDLNEIPDSKFRREMSDFFGSQKMIYVSFLIKDVMEQTPEPEAGFPFGWVEVTDIEITEILSQEIDAENEVVSEKEWIFFDLPQNIQDHLIDLSFEVCDQNPDWGHSECDRIKNYYSEGGY